MPPVHNPTCHSLLSLTTLVRQAVSRTAHDWFESPGGGTRLLPMEGLRGLGVLLVYFVHVHSLFGHYVAGYRPLYGFSEYLGLIGNSGVDLFFLISGFIIYSALVHRPVPYLSFLRRRVERLYPTFLVVLTGYMFLSLLFPSESKIPLNTWTAAKYIIANILLLPGFFRITPIVTVAWSLSFEAVFYVTVPLVVLILGHEPQGSRRRIAFLAGIFCLSAAFLFHGSNLRMLSFLSGMLLQEFTATGKIAKYLTRSGQWISVLLLVILVSYHYAGWSKGSGSRSGGGLSTVLMSVAIFFFVLYSLEYRGSLQKMCTWNPLRYWGNISYSYYLAQGVTLKGMARLLARLQPEHHPVIIYFVALVVGLAATWMSASVLYLFVEKPMSLTPARHTSAGQSADRRGRADLPSSALMTG